MQLTDEQHEDLDRWAYGCDGQPISRFIMTLPDFAGLSMTELCILASELIGRDFVPRSAGDFTAHYVVACVAAQETGRPRPDPEQFWDEWWADLEERAWARREGGWFARQLLGEPALD